MNEYTGAAGALIAGGRPGTARPVTTFTLDNWGAAPSRVLHRGGMPFKKGDIPKNFVPEIRLGETVVAAQFDERVTWKDGSLKFAVMHLRDTDLAAGASNTYEVWAVPGKYNNAGSLSVTAVAAANPLRCEIDGIESWVAGTTFTPRGASAALAKFDSHAAVATRVRKVHSGPVCEGWQVWGMFKDGINGQGAEDAHLKAVWYVDVWKDAAGAELAVEHCAVVAQDWWDGVGKKQLRYNLTYRKGATTVQVYSQVVHPYHSQWATVYLEDDHNHARRHWTTAQPTLTYKPSKTYWVESKLIPPYDTTLPPEPIPAIYKGRATGVYVPCGAIDHRAVVNDYGGYMGRGMLPNFDVMAFLSPTARNVRVARANALAGLGFPGHIRDQRSDGQDISNKIIPLKCDPKPPEYTQVEGLPPPMHAYSGGLSISQFTEAPFWGGTEGGTGSTNEWNINSYFGDMSHGVSYSAYGYMVDGERYLMEAQLDLAANTVQGQNANGGGSCPTLRWDGNAFAKKEMQLPTLQYWSAISNMAGQERAMGLAAAIYAYAAALTPDNDPQGVYIRKWLAHMDDYFAQYRLATPPSARRTGLNYMSENGKHTPWMSGFNVQGCYQVARMNEAPGARGYAELLARMAYGIYQRSLYDTLMLDVFHLNKTLPYSHDNDFFKPGEFLQPQTINAAGGVISSTSMYFDFVDGDEIYFLSPANAPLIPVGIEEGTRFYAVNSAVNPLRTGVITRSCALALTPGGAPVSFPDGKYFIAGKMMGGTSAPMVAAYPPYLPNADSYSSIMRATLAMAETEGHPDIPAGTNDAMRAFLINTSPQTFPSWAMRVPAVTP